MDLRVLFGICVFLACLGWDILRACKRRDLLIQGQALVLSGLTVQLIGYFDIQNVNVFGQNHEQELQILFNKQVSIDISRLIFCVFLGFVLPGVAFAQPGGRWTNIAALVVSFSFHTATEVYMLQNVNNPSIRNEGGSLFISSTVLLSVGTISLVLYLGCAVLHGKLLHDDGIYKIPRMFSQNEGDEEKMITDKIFEAWVVARGCREQHWLASSAFTPVVAMIVTICVVMVGVKVGCQKLVLHNNVGLSFYLRCAFILMAWIIILWRLFFVLLCHAADEFILSAEIGPFDGVGRCLRSFYLYIQTALDPMPLYNLLHSKGVPFVRALLKGLWILPSIFILAIMLLISLLFILLVLFAFFCATLMIILSMILQNVFKEFKSIDLKQKEVGGQEFSMSASSYDEAKNSMQEAYEIGQKSKELVAIVERSDPENLAMVVNKLRRRRHWKMTAVAAISVMVELADGCSEDEEVQVAIKAWKQAEDLLEVLDCPDNIAVDPINLFDTCDFHSYQLSLEAQNKMLKLATLVTKDKQLRPVLTLEQVATVVGWFGGKEKYSENQGPLGPHISFYKNWVKECKYVDGIIDASVDAETKKSMECLCELISHNPYSNKKELMNVAVNFLGDVIGGCVLQLADVLLENRIHWLRDFQEDKLRKAVDIAGKLSGVRNKWNPDERKTDADPENPVECNESEITEEK